MILLWIVLLVVGFVILIKGADWFVDGAAGIAAKFKIPQLVIGLTIVAMGTSAPEAAVSISSSLKGNADITIGNIVGSNLMNVLLILGITSIIVPLAVKRSTVRYEIPYMLLITLVLLLFGFTGNRIVFWEGIVLWALFIAYLAYLFIMAKRNREEGDEIKVRPVWLLLIMLVGGIALVIIGSNFLVDAASAIAAALGMSERFIALTIVAFGTSLPELVTSITAARKNEADLAIGNIVGSNVFNILFVVGTTALITPVAFAQEFALDTVFVFLSGLLLWLCVFKTKELRRWAGIIMLVCYAAYFIYITV
ncbi:MAG: calcium/sodium antiporter [Clostridiales bacterium]|nr:calcium/sodium antiporter [Clostridiales bacterium]